MLDGILLVDKPAGLTSHDVVDQIRRRFQIQRVASAKGSSFAALRTSLTTNPSWRVGHGGTLDPAATGLLILLLGKATRQASLFLGADKSYRATLRLGISTDTQDGEGRILERREVGPLSMAQVEEACARFRGETEQKVPAYSAVRIQGKRSYLLARAGLSVPTRTRRVKIDQLTILEIRLPDLDLEITCSKGTYIRALCADLGAALGCGGYLLKLRRTRIGPFKLEDAVPLEKISAEHLLSVEELNRLAFVG